MKSPGQEELSSDICKLPRAHPTAELVSLSQQYKILFRISRQRRNQLTVMNPLRLGTSKETSDSDELDVC